MRHRHAMKHDDSQAPKGEMERRLMALVAAGGPAKSWSVSELAHAADPEHWQDAVPRVRSALRALAGAGRVVFYRKGKPADPATIKGVYRVGLPRHD